MDTKVDLTQHVNLMTNSLFPTARVVTEVPSTVFGVGVRSYNKQTHKRCIGCREIKTHDKFGEHNSADGLQSFCFDCKNAKGKARRDQNVRARLRHHMSTRITSQLENLCPEDLTKNMEHYLGYSFAALVRALGQKLRKDYPGKRLVEVLQEGWHVDHLRPLSSFKVLLTSQEGVPTEVDWVAFRQCWDPSNLAAIPALDNLKKGASVGSQLLEDPFGLDEDEDEDEE